MGQESMNIALPETMKEFVLARVSEGGYSTASEYVRELIREDQKRGARERLEAMLVEGLEGGNPTPLTKKDWNEIRSQVKRRIQRKR